MSRTVLVAVAAAVVIAGAATGTTIVLTGGGGREASPTVPPFPTESASPSPTPTASPSASPAASPGSTSPAGRPPASTVPAGRSADASGCQPEPRFCSATDGSVVTGGKLASQADGADPTYPDSPSIRIDSQSRKDDGTPAGVGEQVGSIHVEVTVSNQTDRTFVFAKREIVLDIFRDGKRYDRLVTRGPGFEMTPGGRMTAQFDRPIVEDGDYSWRARTSYRAK